MRTTIDYLHLSDHPSRWWVSHTAMALLAAVALVYAASILLVMAGVLLL